MSTSYIDADKFYAAQKKNGWSPDTAQAVASLFGHSIDNKTGDLVHAPDAKSIFSTQGANRYGAAEAGMSSRGLSARVSCQSHGFQL